MGSSRRPYGPIVGKPGERDVLTDIRARLSEEHRLQLDLCAAMANLAGRPTVPGEQRLVRLVAGLLVPSWTEHVALHRQLVFPLLRRHYGRSSRIAARLRDFAMSHELVADLARAAAEELRQSTEAAQIVPGRRLDAVGALLDARRRLLTAERLFVEALLPTTLSANERICVDAYLVSHAWPRLAAESRDNR